ncbi:MAG: hypothetical protein ACREAM_16465 [Blastocatellia bacterium]
MIDLLLELYESVYNVDWLFDQPQQEVIAKIRKTKFRQRSSAGVKPRLTDQ